jgi:hypothetical protein
MTFGKRGERRGAGQWVSLCTGLRMLSEGLLDEGAGIEQRNVVSACRGGGYVCGLLCSSEVDSCRLTGPTLLRIVVSEGGGQGACVCICVYGSGREGLPVRTGGPACSYLCVSRVGGCKMREPASSSTTW